VIHRANRTQHGGARLAEVAHRVFFMRATKQHLARPTVLTDPNHMMLLEKRVCIMLVSARLAEVHETLDTMRRGFGGFVLAPTQIAHFSRGRRFRDGEGGFVIRCDRRRLAEHDVSDLLDTEIILEPTDAKRGERGDFLTHGTHDISPVGSTAVF
jgi:hypothetical protein